MSVTKKKLGYWPALVAVGGGIMLTVILANEASRPVMTVSQTTAQVPGPDCRGTDHAPQLTTIKRSFDYPAVVSSKAIFNEWVKRHHPVITVKSVSADGNRIDVLWECK